jgi:tripartite-type tricarboxylate transporter receptor subunit TctC
MQRLIIGTTTLALAIGVSAATAQTRTFPTKPVRVLVGYAPGGLPDTVARQIAQRLADKWGQQVLVDNRPSANGILAAELTAKAAPDGYTLLVTDSSTTAINPALYAKLPYDAQRDFMPVVLAAVAPLFLAAHNSVTATSLQEFIAQAKAQPGKVTYGSSGIGSTHHLTMAQLASLSGIDVVHVPYKGTGQSVPALVSGQVNYVWSAFPSLAGHTKAGTVKFLAVNSAKRSALAPNLPTVAEVINQPDFNYAPSIGFLAPAKLPAELATLIAADVTEVAKMPELRTALTNVGVEAVGGTPAEYATLLKADAERYARAVKASGAKAE